MCETKDLRECFGCSICGPDGLGRVCEDVQHLTADLSALDVRRPGAFLAHYRPLDIRRQIGALRYYLAHAPQKIRHPVQYLFVALKVNYDLPIALVPAWHALMAERAKRNDEAMAKVREKSKEVIWRMPFERLEAYLETLSEGERHALAADIVAWAKTSEGRKYRPEDGWTPESVFEGWNRIPAIRYLQKVRPSLAAEIGVALNAISTEQPAPPRGRRRPRARGRIRKAAVSRSRKPTRTSPRGGKHI